MPVSMFSAQLGLGSDLVVCYRDATSVPYSHLLMYLSPRTDYKLRYCTNSGKVYIPDRLKHLKSLDDEYTKSLKSPSDPLTQKQKFSPSVLSKRVFPVSLQMHSKLLKVRSTKANHMAKFQDEIRLFFLQETTWRQRRDVLAFKKGLQFIKVITFSVINHLSWHGAVIPGPVFL